MFAGMSGSMNGRCSAVLFDAGRMAARSSLVWRTCAAETLCDAAQLAHEVSAWVLEQSGECSSSNAAVAVWASSSACTNGTQVTATSWIAATRAGMIALRTVRLVDGLFMARGYTTKLSMWFPACWRQGQRCVSTPRGSYGGSRTAIC